jgi:hypothetical protein
MELLIRIVNSEPFEHPIFIENFVQAFPNVDTNNLPPEFARFERIPRPQLVYDVLNSPEPTYQWVNGIVKDVWDIRPMTVEEKTEKQNQTKAMWAIKRFYSWNFDESTCTFQPPTPKPDDGKDYRWNEEQLAWIEIT